MKTRIFIYVVASSSDPDNIICPVPWRVNDKEIFFGPCKKKLRIDLKKEYLINRDYCRVNDNVYIIGLNGSNSFKKRKIVFVGKINEVMTFEQAYIRLQSKEYNKMRTIEVGSPLHVKLIKQGEISRYIHLENGHHIKDWQADLSSRKQNSKDFVNIKEADRDCCILLKNIFWADGKNKYSEKKIEGIDINRHLLDLLIQGQPNARMIDDYAVFGKDSKGSAIGKRGTYLNISGNLAEQIVYCIEKLIMK